MKELKNPLPEEDKDEIDDGFSGHKSITTVGLSDLTEEIVNELLVWQMDIRTVSLVGMAGIGKSHLANHICNHPRIIQHFNSRLWVRVGSKDRTNNICLDIVAQIMNEPRDAFKGESERTLRDLLRNGLRIGRYLIVLDDIWSTQVLDYFRELLPDYGKRSRFLVTTRLHEVARYYPHAQIHQVPFFNNEESWILLWQNVFADENSFPPQLEEAGRKIAEICEGLPLLILTVAHILRGLDRTEEYWKKVAEKKTTTFTDAYNQIYKVLLPSYENLPQHLKGIFLYMGVFPQSSEIPYSKLIRLLVVEDLLEPSRQQTLEDCGMECLLDLFSKSLAIVSKGIFTIGSWMPLVGNKSCKVHSAYWHLCVTEAKKNKFFQVLKKLTDVSTEKQRRLSVQNNILFGIKEGYDAISAITSSTRSLVCSGEDHPYPVEICFNMMLLKVLHVLTIRFYSFPEEVLKLLQLRYLTLTHNGELPSSINKLQQLQCLIIRRHHTIILLRDSTSTCLPQEIWDLQELRHLRIMGSSLPDPTNGTKLQKLITLYVNAHCCTEAVFRGVPNLKKLGIKIELQPNAAKPIRCYEHIGLLNSLVSLKCVVVNPQSRSQVDIPPHHISKLPRGLEKLSLNGLGYSPYMSELTNLQVLKLRCSAYQGLEWRVWSNLYRYIKFLQLEDVDLVHWKASQLTFFPYLCHLIVRHCYKLKMIPPEIGQSLYLERIEVDDCSPSVVASAHQIKSKMRSLQLVINSSWN